jgi:glucose-6-phosphate isomerase
MDEWTNFEKYFFGSEKLGMRIDFGAIGFSDEFFAEMSKKINAAYGEMAALESGAIANGDENRMVGHYWLRNSNIAPSKQIQEDIEANIRHIVKFAESVSMGHTVGQNGKFENALFLGIGGSALGPQLICESLGGNGRISCHFIDNTDPDGMDIVLGKLSGKLGKTLVVVTSKSGSTPEPRNAMVEVISAFEREGCAFPRHAVAITSVGSLLDKQAAADGWIDRFPMWEWVGGRNSVFSAVGLLPAALSGHSLKNFIGGARDMDDVTRKVSEKNPAMLMALAWYIASGGVGNKDMVVIPYKDRLLSFSKCLQQLVMESLGKRNDRRGNVVRQGLAVYGNKGSTDQHSIVQQLRDGLQNFFVTIISVLRSRDGDSIAVDADGMTSGDYLNGFALGTMAALRENGTGIIHVTVDKFSEYELGMLIALYERAVGFYGGFIDVNAYNQPGVEAGKKAASRVLQKQKLIASFLGKSRGKFFTIGDIAEAVSMEEERVLLFKLLEHMAANGQIRRQSSGNIIAATYGMQ